MKIKDYIVGTCGTSGKITMYHSLEEAESNASHYKVFSAASYQEARTIYQELLSEIEDNNQ